MGKKRKRAGASTNADDASYTKQEPQSSGRKDKDAVPQGVSSNWMQLQATLGKSHGVSSKKKMRAAGADNLDASATPGARGTDLRASRLAPTSDDTSLTRALALDCEMVGVGFEGKRNALARVSLVNQWGNVVYDKHVRPREFVKDFRTAVSGVRPRDLRRAEDMYTVQKEVADLIKGRVLVGHALHNDLKVLMLSHPRRSIRDTHSYAPFCKNGRPRALRHLASLHLGCQIQDGEHNAVEDARAAMALYELKKVEWEESLRQRNSTAHDKDPKIKHSF